MNILSIPERKERLKTSPCFINILFPTQIILKKTTEDSHPRAIKYSSTCSQTTEKLRKWNLGWFHAELFQVTFAPLAKNKKLLGLIQPCLSLQLRFITWGCIQVKLIRVVQFLLIISVCPSIPLCIYCVLFITSSFAMSVVFPSCGKTEIFISCR